MAILKLSGVNREVPNGFYNPSGVIPDPVGFSIPSGKIKTVRNFPVWGSDCAGPSHMPRSQVCFLIKASCLCHSVRLRPPGNIVFLEEKGFVLIWSCLHLGLWIIRKIEVNLEHSNNIFFTCNLWSRQLPSSDILKLSAANDHRRSIILLLSTMIGSKTLETPHDPIL